jgi:predicted 3-demethylubiquinone-9 3-methyltransferase (glyoxalase superfamily)
MPINSQKITPCLWFDTTAEDAAKFYCAIFDNSRITSISRYGEEGHEIHGKPAGSVMAVAFELEDQKFSALNGGPQFKFDEAISFQVHCKDQGEVDYYWGKLTADGGTEGPCGWLKDRFGLSWQVVPAVLYDMLTHKDHAASQRVTKAFLQMKKFDIAALERAFEGEAA